MSTLNSVKPRISIQNALFIQKCMLTFITKCFFAELRWKPMEGCEKNDKEAGQSVAGPPERGH